MKVKAKQRIGVVKINGKQVPSGWKKGGMVLNAGRMPRIRQKTIVAKSGERKSSVYIFSRGHRYCACYECSGKICTKRVILIKDTNRTRMQSKLKRRILL